MLRKTLMFPFTLTLLSACDTGGTAAAPSVSFAGPVAPRSGPLPSANPCEALTPAAYADAIAAIDAAIAMTHAHQDAHSDDHYAGASDDALAGFYQAREMLADQRDAIAAGGYLVPFVSNTTMAGGTYQVTMLNMWDYLAEATWWASIATVYEHSNEGQAAVLLGIAAQQKVQALGGHALACFVRPYVTCGDGVVDAAKGETCDDGNKQSHDGCSMACKAESPYECDTRAQDCPEGQKCSPYALGGGSSWDSAKCVVVTGEGAPGDACTAEGGGVSGLDSCREGSMCWEVDGENMGVCVELCGQGPGGPSCSDEAAFSCAVAIEGVLELCLPDCDPLAQDCAGGDLCLPVDESFVCVFDASGEGAGGAFSPCEFANACDPRHLCLSPTLATECDQNAGGCCLPLCDLGEPSEVCPGQGLSCVSFYAEDIAPPPGHENVGVCQIPS